MFTKNKENQMHKPKHRHQPSPHPRVKHKMKIIPPVQNNNRISK